MSGRALKPSLDPHKICTAVKARFPDEPELQTIASSVLEALEFRASLDAAEKEAFEKLGGDIQKNTTQVVNMVRSRLATKAFQEFISTVQKASSPTTSLESEGQPGRRQQTRRGSVPDAGSPAALIAALRAALGPDANRLRISESAVSFVNLAVDGWLTSTLLKVQERSLWRAPAAMGRDCSAEEFLLGKELSAVQMATKLAGGEIQPFRQEELRLLAADETETAAKTSRMLRRLSCRDVVALLRLGDYPEHFNNRFSNQAAYMAALVDLRTRVPTQLPT